MESENLTLNYTRQELSELSEAFNSKKEFRRSILKQIKNVFCI